MAEEPGEITLLLNRWRAGSRDAENQLFTLVLPNLRRLAHFMMRKERKGHTLQPTELVGQAYLRIVGAKDRDWRNRQHFFAIAARIMRRYLIDYARGRPDADCIPLEGIERLLPADSAKLNLAVTIDRLLDRLTEVNPAWCELVELKYFLGLTDEEAAETMGLKLRSMQRMWGDARQWLFKHLDSGDARESAGR